VLEGIVAALVTTRLRLKDSMAGPRNGSRPCVLPNNRAGKNGRCRDASGISNRPDL